MKKTLKKVLCSALAAVSLSAMVTVPSSLNKPNSHNSFVNVMEADATIKLKVLYEGYITYNKNNKYFTRRNPWKLGDSYDDKNTNIIPISELKQGSDQAESSDFTLYKYKHVQVYETKGNWARISPDNETFNGKKRERWVAKSRIYQDKIGCQDGHDHAHADYKVLEKSTGRRDYYLCTYCGKQWIKAR